MVPVLDFDIDVQTGKVGNFGSGRIEHKGQYRTMTISDRSSFHIINLERKTNGETKKQILHRKHIEPSISPGSKLGNPGGYVCPQVSVSMLSFKGATETCLCSWSCQPF